MRPLYSHSTRAVFDPGPQDPEDPLKRYHYHLASQHFDFSRKYQNLPLSFECSGLELPRVKLQSGVRSGKRPCSIPGRLGNLSLIPCECYNPPSCRSPSTASFNNFTTSFCICSFRGASVPPWFETDAFSDSSTSSFAYSSAVLRLLS